MTSEAKVSYESVPTTGDARFLKHYSEELRQSLLDAKQDFVSFLLGLQSMRLKDYVFLAVHEKRGEEYKHLFIEWIVGNEIFTDKELGYCPKLRNLSFVEAFRQMFFVPLFNKYLISYVIAYMAVK